MIDSALKARLVGLGSTERARLSTEGALTRTAQVLGVTRAALDEALREVRSEYHDAPLPVTPNALAGASATQALVSQRSVWATGPELPSLGLKNPRPQGGPLEAPLSFRGAHASAARFTDRVELTLQAPGGDTAALLRKLAQQVSTAAFTSGADAWDVLMKHEPNGSVRITVELAGDEKGVGATGVALERALRADPDSKLEGPVTHDGPWSNYTLGGGGGAPAGEPGLSDRSGDVSRATFATRLVLTLDGDGAVRRLGQHVAAAGKDALADGWDLVVLGSEGGKLRVGLELVGGQDNVQKAGAAIEQAMKGDAELNAVAPTVLGVWGNYGY